VADSSPNVALLGRDDAVRAQLRKALDELGATLVYEGEFRGVDPGLVLAHRPGVLLFNLDADGEEGLEGLDALFGEPDLRVIFNEAETTASLSGWDLARWARHLAAKVLGHGLTIPPPPAGSERLPEPGEAVVGVWGGDVQAASAPVADDRSGSEPDDAVAAIRPGAPPTPESQADPLPMETLAGEALDSIDQVPVSDSLVGSAGAPAFTPDASVDDDALGELDLSDIASALAGGTRSTVEVAHRAVPEMIDEAGDTLDGPDESITLEDVPRSSAADIGFDAERIEDMLSGDGATAGDPLDTGEDLQDLEAELAALAEVALDAEDNVALGVGTLDTEDRLDAEDETVVSFSSLQGGFDSADATDEGDLDEAVAALAAQLDELESSAPPVAEEVRDPDFAFDLSDDADAPAAADKARELPSGLSLSLAAADEPMVAAPTARRDVLSTINLDHLSLEALPDPGVIIPKEKPRATEEPPYVPRPGIDLTLTPREETGEIVERAPEKPSHQAVQADIGETDGARDSAAAVDDDPLSGLSLAPLEKTDDAPKVVRINRVIVLGASIGGPDALRSFLASLPQEFPALFILAQHLESGFFDRLAQQLQKVSKLPVRVAGPFVRATMSEVLVVPSGHRVIVSRDGEVTLEAHAGPTHYQPCIDDVLRDVADRFGRNATAIIFSGMAGDAVEGAIYLTAKGGEVWAQDPASCVVSSMVDGAMARGVVEFVGSPRELAEQCIARFGKE